MKKINPHGNVQLWLWVFPAVAVIVVAIYFMVAIGSRAGIFVALVVCPPAFGLASIITGWIFKLATRHEWTGEIKRAM